MGGRERREHKEREVEEMDLDEEFSRVSQCSVMATFIDDIILQLNPCSHIMVKFPPYLKHHILTHYQPYSSDNSFASLATRYGVKGGARTIHRWHDVWNGTIQSLERKRGSGRKRVLSKRQVHQYIRMPIQNKRRHHLPVHCPELHSNLEQKTGIQISSRSIRRYSQRDVGARLIPTNKKTAHECE